IHRLFDSLIMNDMSTSEVLEKAKKLGISLAARCFQMIRVYFAISGESADSFSENRNAIGNAFAELMTDREECILFDRGIDGFAVLVMGDDKQETESLSGGVIKELKKILDEGTDIDYFIGVGNVTERLSEIRYTYDEANKALARRFLSNGERVIYSYGDDKRNNETESKALNIVTVVDTESPHKAMESFLKTGCAAEADPLMDSIFASIGEQNIKSKIFLNYVTMDIYFSMARFIKEMKVDNAEIENEMGDINSLISKSRSEEEIKDYLKKYLKRVVEIRDSKSAKRYSRLLQNAISYIDENYASEDISLNSVASTVNISPNHFSTIFSQEVGQTFIEYLITKRMDKAKELLMTTDMRSSEIAYAVGYKDPHYFSYTFKKTQGMTSREFRTRGRSENV
ncbi:MAG: helix-turn-helix domain-containing protein, partial [Lachnospiraceae bacterium]|nr:helix-turn-helix domain-containing protein [Lachnospiraceae bacterium]